ncbi:hypothetical protein E4U53_001114 [Claviceps sorghi]|nr:hypothetical protein E4U53_001114 [Claviceps sorghi]
MAPARERDRNHQHQTSSRPEALLTGSWQEQGVREQGAGSRDSKCSKTEAEAEAEAAAAAAAAAAASRPLAIDVCTQIMADRRCLSAPCLVGLLPSAMRQCYQTVSRPV